MRRVTHYIWIYIYHCTCNMCLCLHEFLKDLLNNPVTDRIGWVVDTWRVLQKILISKGLNSKCYWVDIHHLPQSKYNKVYLNICIVCIYALLYSIITFNKTMISFPYTSYSHAFSGSTYSASVTVISTSGSDTDVSYRPFLRSRVLTPTKGNKWSETKGSLSECLEAFASEFNVLRLQGNRRNMVSCDFNRIHKMFVCMN